MNDQLDAVQIVESLARQISEYAQRVAILEAENKKLVHNLTAQIAQQATQIAILQTVIEQMTGTAEEPTESEDVGTTD
jgi:hypothetical protein